MTFHCMIEYVIMDDPKLQASSPVEGRVTEVSLAAIVLLFSSQEYFLAMVIFNAFVA